MLSATGRDWARLILGEVNKHLEVTGSMNELPVLDASLPEAVATARECLFGAAAAIVVRTGEPRNLGVRLLDFAAAIGRVVPQTEQGDVLDQVTFTPGPHVRGAKTRRALPFHTDLGPNCPDVFLLGCVASASQGGATVLVKASDACDVLTRAAPTQVRTAPAQVLDQLSDPFPFDISDAADDSADAVRWWPVLATAADGTPSMTYNRARIHRGFRARRQPMPQACEHALDALDAALAVPEIQSAVTLAPGDVLCVNNRRCLHAREPFSDDLSPRLLLRAWLVVEPASGSAV